MVTHALFRMCGCLSYEKCSAWTLNLFISVHRDKLLNRNKIIKTRDLEHAPDADRRVLLCYGYSCTTALGNSCGSWSTETWWELVWMEGGLACLNVNVNMNVCICMCVACVWLCLCECVHVYCMCVTVSWWYVVCCVYVLVCVFVFLCSCVYVCVCVCVCVCGVSKCHTESFS